MRVTAGIDLPKRYGDAGYDLTADHTETLLLGGRAIFECASVEIPDGYCGLIIGRSSLNMQGILTVFGLIDSGYRGPIKVMLYNISGRYRTIMKDERIAQLVMVPYGNFPIEVVESLSVDTERGTDGFGSTGQ